MPCPPHDYVARGGRQVCTRCGVIDLASQRLLHDVIGRLEADGIRVTTGAGMPHTGTSDGSVGNPTNPSPGAG